MTPRSKEVVGALLGMAKGLLEVGGVALGTALPLAPRRGGEPEVPLGSARPARPPGVEYTLDPVTQSPRVAATKPSKNRCFSSQKQVFSESIKADMQRDGLAASRVPACSAVPGARSSGTAP